MTTDLPNAQSGLFIADFYPELGEYLAERHTTGYDAVAGRTRFLIWLAAHVDDGAADQLVKDHHHLVLPIAERFAGRDVALADLITAGSRGLARAARSYDPAKGYSFEAYATWFIRGAIRKAAGPSQSGNISGKGDTEHV